MEKKKILYDSPEAAEYKINKGWISANDRFYGQNEDMARYDGCTHKICQCGKEMEKHWTNCESCRNKLKWERYFKVPFKEYDGSPTFLFDDDKFFMSPDDIEMWLEDFDPEDVPEEVHLMMCEEAFLPQVDYVQMVSDSDITWEDWDGQIPKAVEEKVNELNEVIKQQKNFSWVEGKYRTTYKPIKDEEK